MKIARIIVLLAAIALLAVAAAGVGQTGGGTVHFMPGWAGVCLLGVYLLLHPRNEV